MTTSMIANARVWKVMNPTLLLGGARRHLIDIAAQ
jgi:hypothetical protein